MDDRAVSPIVGTVLVLSILTVTAGTLLAVVWPEVQDNRARGDFTTVTNGLSAFAADSRQMASLGNVGELRQNNIHIPRGQFYLADGHVYAVATAILNEDYQAVRDESVSAGAHAGLVVDDAVTATASAFNVSYTGADTFILERFDGRRWVIPDGATCAVISAGLLGCELGDGTVRDGPWRLQATDGTRLQAELYVYDQTRWVYEQHERRERGATVENGGLFTVEDGVVLQLVPSLWHGRAEAGGIALQGRSTTFVSSDYPQAGGRTTSTVALTTQVHAHFAHQQGAVHTRVQVLSGPEVDVWLRHLVEMGFRCADADDPSKGVVYTVPPPLPSQECEEPIDPTTDLGTYPFNMVHAELGVRMVVR